MKKNILLKHIIRSIPLLILLFLFSCRQNSKVTVNELQDHIKYLSSDSLKGRLTGSTGDSLAAEYIKSKLLSYGLNPLNGDGLQRFKVTKKIAAGKNNSLSVNGKEYVCDKDFMPLAFSSNTQLESEVVFAGYGFNINSDTLKWNDYNGIDVKGKWVLILKGDPEPENTKSKFILFSADRDKALLAKDM